jgi:hypothetical protein
VIAHRDCAYRRESSLAMRTTVDYLESTAMARARLIAGVRQRRPGESPC